MAAKIKDGLFIGDAETSQSEVFINDNKISNLINLSGREVHNVWAPHGLVYLTYYWEDRPDYKLFASQEDSLLTDIVEFIDVSISHGISVLLFSRNGTGRCVIAACVYLMMKYRWGFEKTYDYVYSKKPDVDLNKGFIQQMFALDMKLLAARQKAYASK
ncbi:protein-tyrosine phosphatase-like protein, partial [Ochromonadaceae sp. CCMP2298]